MTIVLCVDVDVECELCGRSVVVLSSRLDVDDDWGGVVCELLPVKPDVSETILDSIFVEIDLVRLPLGNVEVDPESNVLLSPFVGSELFSVVVIVEYNSVEVVSSVLPAGIELEAGLTGELVEETGTSTKSGVIDIATASDGGTLSPKATTSCPIGSV